MGNYMVEEIRRTTWGKPYKQHSVDRFGKILFFLTLESAKQHAKEEFTRAKGAMVAWEVHLLHDNRKTSCVARSPCSKTHKIGV